MDARRKMKWLLICALLLASLVSCTIPIGSYFCDTEEKVCVKLTVAEPIKPSQLVSATITIISAKDIPELFVLLSSYPFQGVSIDEEPGEPSPKRGAVSWTSSVHAYHRLTFTRNIRLPLIEEEYIPGQYGGYALIDLQASVWVAGRAPVADGLTIFVTSQGGKAYHWDGEPLPITPGPVPTITPGPSPTFIPTLTFIPTPTPYLTPTP